MRFPGYSGLVAAFDTDPQAEAKQERPLVAAGA